MTLAGNLRQQKHMQLWWHCMLDEVEGLRALHHHCLLTACGAPLRIRERTSGYSWQMREMTKVP